jgi:nitrate/nitrite-specific signal transduction histidine kinase
VSPTAPAASAAPPKFKRSAKNYLLDKRFQLKYTGYIVGLTAVLSLVLGGLLYWQSEKTVAIGHEAVQVGEEASRAGRDAVAQSQALNSKLENDALVSYGDDPALLATIKDANKAESDKINARAAALAAHETKLVAKHDAIAKQRTLLLGTLGTVLLLMVVILGLAGIVITHKVAGPIYKMKRLLRDVGDGRLVVPGKLRKGDELIDFFDVFATMVEKLRVRQQREIELLDAAIAQARANDAPLVEKLEALRKTMQTDLDAK